jgi:ABC-type multidrug transport system permease subunit
MKTREFFRRWGEGIQAITPYQQIKISLVGNFLVFVGVIVGLITTFMLAVWWLFIILLGSLFLTSMGSLGNFQKFLALKRINNQLNNMEDGNEQFSTS